MVYHAIIDGSSDGATTKRVGSDSRVGQLNDEIPARLLSQLAMNFLNAIQYFASSVSVPVQPQHPIAKEPEEPTLNAKLPDRFVTTLRKPGH